MQAPDRLPIVAIATAAGRGGVGIVRLSFGTTPHATARALVRELLGLNPEHDIAPRHATYLPFRDADGQTIDRGIALWFPGPHSYTGEDVLELQGHGGPVVLQLLLRRCLQAGAAIGLRLAVPGEFTERAFLNDKLDLAQAEAVADLIEASTEAAARSASRSLEGEFSGAIRTLVDQVIQLRMLVEATLDFPEEEIDFLEASNASGQLAAIREQLAIVLSQARQGALLREGLNVVLAGAPNVGKSSLLNALAGAELAIVTPIAGTTRDRVQQAIQIEGIPLNIIDTAGLRDTEDEVERIGIARSWEAIATADVVLHLSAAHASPADGANESASSRAGDAAAVDIIPVTDRNTEVTADLGAEISARLPHGVPVLEVRNKIDLSGETPRITLVDDHTCVWLSARQKSGIDLLRGELMKIAGWQRGNDSVYLARERHLVALRAAGAHLDAAAEHAAQQAQALDLFAEELRLAQDRLNEITGEFTPDDLLGVIFSRFCIGK